MSNVPSLSELQRSNIQVSRDGDKISLYHITPGATGKPKKTLLHIKTGCWTCPYGKDDQGKLTVVISDNQYFKVDELDKFGRDVCKYFLRQAGQEVPEDLDDLPYKSLIQNVDGLDVLQLQMTDRTRVFDSNGIKLSDEQSSQCTAGQFSGHFLLQLGLRVWSGAGEDGKFYWSVQPIQIKIKRYCSLPEGCVIFDNEAELEEELHKRKKITIKKRVQDEEAVADFDPDVNELMD